MKKNYSVRATRIIRDGVEARKTFHFESFREAYEFSYSFVRKNLLNGFNSSCFCFNPSVDSQSFTLDGTRSFGVLLVVSRTGVFDSRSINCIKIRKGYYR